MTLRLLPLLVLAACTPETPKDTSAPVDADTGSGDTEDTTDTSADTADTSADTDTPMWDGVYIGNLSFSVRVVTDAGSLEDSCAGIGNATVEVSADSADPVKGTAECTYSGYLEGSGLQRLSIQGVMGDGDSASGDVSHKDVTYPWTGTFAGDTLDAGFGGTSSSGGDDVTVTGMFSVVR